MAFDTAQQGSAIWQLVSPSGYYAVFNDQAHADNVGALVGENAVTGIDSPEVRSALYDRVEADGSVFGNFYHGHRPVTLTAQIYAATIAERNARESKLYRVLADLMRGTGSLIWTPAGSVSQYVNVRKFQPARVRGGWVKDVFVSLVAADPYIYGASLNTATDAAGGGALTVVNEGNAAREPALLRVTGPTNGTVVIRNATPTNQDITFLSSMPALATSEYIDIDPLNRTIRHSSGLDYYQYLNYGATIWWRLAPGNNTVSLQGTTTTGTLRIDWRHTWV